MASLRLLRVLGQDRVGSALLSVARPSHWRYVARQSRCRLTIAAALSHSVSGDHVGLHELVSQGRYCEAVDEWERAKEEGVADSALYTSVMKMAAQVGGVEAVQSVKEDMESQGWGMDQSCSLHYLGSLAKEGHVRDAVKFVKSSHLKKDPSFLAECADLLAEIGHLQAALDVCSLFPSPSSPSPSSPSPHSHHIPLLTVQLETLGRLGSETEIEELVERVCGDSVSPEVQTAMSIGWCLAGQQARALEILKGLRSRNHHIPVKSLALLLESARRDENYTLAAEACSLFWNKSTAQPSDEAILSSPTCLSHHTSYHCRAIAAAFYLQAFAHRDTTNVDSSTGGQLRSFLERNFFQEMLHHRYLPTPDMYQALVLLSCHHSPALAWADAVIKQCRATGQIVPASSLTSWVHNCGTISPNQALKVIHMVRAHRHHYQLELDLSNYGDLLAIRYHCHDDISRQKEALNCIRAIKNSMDTWGVLNTTEAFNLVLKAVVAIPAVGAHYTTYNDMTSSHVDPDLETFHLLLDGTLAEGSVKNTKKAAYYLWRSLMKEWPRVRPEVELVNKFIRCCVVCGDAERGLVFLSALSDCSVEPDVQTFTLLLQLCHSTNQRESFESVLKLAEHCLPDEAPQVRTLAHKLQRQWRAQEDISLVQGILSHLDTSI